MLLKPQETRRFQREAINSKNKIPPSHSSCHLPSKMPLVLRNLRICEMSLESVKSIAKSFPKSTNFENQLQSQAYLLLGYRRLIVRMHVGKLNKEEEGKQASQESPNVARKTNTTTRVQFSYRTLINPWLLEIPKPKPPKSLT